MTHGDAIMVISNPGTTVEAKLGALDVIVNDELPSDYMHIRQPIMWDLLKIVYDKYKKKGKSNQTCDYCKTIYSSIEQIQEAEYESIGNDEVCIVSDGIVYDGKHKRYDLVLPEVDGTHRAIADIKYCPYCGEQLIHQEV